MCVLARFGIGAMLVPRALLVIEVCSCAHGGSILLLVAILASRLLGTEVPNYYFEELTGPVQSDQRRLR